MTQLTDTESSNSKLKGIVEAALLASGQSLPIRRLQKLFVEEEMPEIGKLQDVLNQLQQEYVGRGIELVSGASGYRIQVNQKFAPWVSRLWEEKPQRYSRALLETLALIAYRQPITRGEIEEVRGVVVSSAIMKTLQEREWIRVLGQKDVPGRPSLYGTTKEFLDHFNLNSLDELPSLIELIDVDEGLPVNGELAL